MWNQRRGRATWQTELTDKFPLHVVCEWLGNSAPIADKHYLQVTDEHYSNAIVSPANENSAESNAQVARGIEKAAQQVAATGGTNSQETKQARAGQGLVRRHAVTCQNVQVTQVAGAGLLSASAK